MHPEEPTKRKLCRISWTHNRQPKCVSIENTQHCVLHSWWARKWLVTPKSDCNTYDCLLSEFGDRFLSAGRVISDEQATKTILGWSWEQWRRCRTSQRQPIWHRQHGKGEVLSFFKLGTTRETERKFYFYSCSSPQSTHDTSYNMLNLIKLTLCCKLLSTYNIPQRPRMAKAVKIKGDELAA